MKPFVHVTPNLWETKNFSITSELLSAVERKGWYGAEVEAMKYQ